MKNLIPVAIIIVLAISVGVPFVTGKVAETQIKTIINQTAQSPLSYGSNEILSYDRGLLNSTSVYRYTMPLAYQKLTNLDSFDYQCDLDHGVLGIDYDCMIIDNPSYSAIVDTYFGGKSPLSMSGNINAFGDISHTIAIDEINELIIDSNNQLISLDATKLTIDTDKDFQNYTISGQLNNFSLTSGDEVMALEQLRLGGDLSKLNDTLFVGDLDMNINQIDLRSPDNDILMQDLTVVTSAAENGANLDSIMQFSIAQMNLSDAPVASIDSVKFETLIGGLNIEAFTEYQAFAKQMQQDLIAGGTSQPPALEMVPLVEKMLQKGFSFGIDTSGNLDGEPNSFKFNIKLNDALTMGDIMSIAIVPDTALGKFIFNLNTAISADLPADFNNNPLLKRNGEQVELALAIGDKVILNGEEISMQELQGLLISNVPR